MFRAIKANNISDYECLITPEDGFIKRIDTERGYIAYDTGIFSNSDKFPDVNLSMDDETIRKNLLRRDLRGIKFSLSTGKLICRPLTKMFNVGERIETFPENIDISKPQELLKKLDGSMISAMIPDDGNLYYTTKKGVTPICQPIVDFVTRKSNSIGYNDFNNKLIRDGFTPVYEWCSRKQRIVLDYPEDMLTLIALRHMEEGYFLSTNELHLLANEYSIPVVETVKVKYNSVSELVDITKALKGEEGYIFIVGDERFKIKADEYCRIHKTLEGLVFEKDIIHVICDNKIDDIIPHLPEDVVEKLSRFQRDLISNITETSKMIISEFKKYIIDCDNKKDFALKIKNLSPSLKSQMFNIYDIYNPNEDILDDVMKNLVDVIMKNCSSSGRINSVRWIFNINWDDYYISNI